MNNEDAEQYLSEASIGRYSPEKIKNVNGGIRKVGLVMHCFGIATLAYMAVNSYLHGDYGTAGISLLGELFIVPATYLFERATRPK